MRYSLSMSMCWGFLDDPKETEDKSPEGARTRALKELKAPATCQVPVLGRDVIYKDWLFRFTDACDIGIEIICPTLAIWSFLMLLSWIPLVATGALATTAALISGGILAA